MWEKRKGVKKGKKGEKRGKYGEIEKKNWCCGHKY